MKKRMDNIEEKQGTRTMEMVHHFNISLHCGDEEKPYPNIKHYQEIKQAEKSGVGVENNSVQVIYCFS